MKLDGDLATAVKLLAAAAAALWGAFTPLAGALVALMLLDLAGGILVAWQGRALASGVLFRGVTRKAMVLLLLGAARVLEGPTALTFLDDAVAGFYLAHEGLSLVEHATALGLPVPRQLREALRRLQPEEAPGRPGGEGAP